MPQQAAGVPWKDLVPLISLGVAVLGFVLTHFGRIRSTCSRGWLTFLGAVGVVRARYKAAFLKNYRELQNIYLNRIEKLDLVSTYVPLRVLDSSHSTSDIPALELLLDPNQQRIVILGDPGTGKTTLLKSFGIGLVSPNAFRASIASAELARTAKASERLHLLPIYVELRDFAAHLGEHPSLADYVARSVLPALLGGTDHTRFLRELLKDGRCTLLLDALDEVSESEYDRLRVAILTFISGTDDLMPTSAARVVMTSRIQNFLTVVDDWIPSGFERYSILAPLSDGAMRQFLDARASHLPSGKTPDALWGEIAASGTLELHRTPLILTISLGLYINVPRYQIPSSIARFYGEIVLELLQRHDFRTRSHLTKRNIFNADVKASFLRQFALTTAQRRDQFDEFGYDELVDAYKVFVRRVASLNEQDGHTFIGEIVTGSGLLRRVGSTGTYVFAHRSFHEYFAAAQLARSAASNIGEVVQRSSSPQWRQIIIFLMAMDHDASEPLLEALAQTAPELAGYCLGVAPAASSEVTELILARLEASLSTGVTATGLASLAAVARKTDGTTKERTLRIIRDSLQGIAISSTTVSAANALWQLSSDDLFNIVNGLAAIGGRDIASMLSATSRLAESDSRFVGPLWIELRSLADVPDCPEAREIVKRLIELAYSAEGLSAIEASPAFAVPFVDERAMKAMFPFTALPRRRNLVTLLVWAESYKAMPEKPNAYIMAARQRDEFPMTWRDSESRLTEVTLLRSPRAVATCLFWSVWLAGIALMVVAVRQGLVAVLLAVSGMRPTLALSTAIGLCLATAIGIGALQPFLVRKHWSLANSSYFGRAANPFPGMVDDLVIWLTIDGVYFWDLDTAKAIALLAVVSLPTFAAFGGVLGGTPARFLLAGTLGVTACFWIPALRMFTPAGTIITVDPLKQVVVDLSTLLWLDIRRPDLVSRIRHMSTALQSRTDSSSTT